MKKLFQRGALLMAFLLLIPVFAHTDSYPPTEVETLMLSKRKWVGIWDYSVSDVPPEYSTGALHVSKSGRDYEVALELEFGKIPAKSVVVKSKVLYFEVDVDGMLVEITLNRVGNAVSGEASSANGVFFLEGTRRE